MLTGFLNRFLGAGDDQPMPADRSDLALAALMVRVARADGHYDAQERGLILRMIERRAGLGPSDAEARLTEAENLEADAPDTVRFTRAIKENVPLEDRMSVMQDIWTVALADGTRDPGEDQMLRLCASLLGIEDRDSALARQRAAADAGLV